MNVVDSSGWIEYFINGPNTDLFASPIQDTENLIVPTICLYEVFKRVLLVLGDDKALKTIGQMSLGTFKVLDRNIAMRAAQISLEIKLAMADSIILATARSFNATLWTQDEHFKDLEGVRYIEKK
ncbi:MAG: type II toxin-antitoxin system VapC family toxin [Anaerolineales bacterium]